ncbi:hypothetical protein BDR06DRAFT_948445 [Suillus hirtellus]|nr:hypothetical protein BDR06DRAFT_948445 [Suillus hirtellus]
MPIFFLRGDQAFPDALSGALSVDLDSSLIDASSTSTQMHIAGRSFESKLTLRIYVQIMPLDNTSA